MVLRDERIELKFPRIDAVVGSLWLLWVAALLFVAIAAGITVGILVAGRIAEQHVEQKMAEMKSQSDKMMAEAKAQQAQLIEQQQAEMKAKIKRLTETGK